MQDIMNWAWREDKALLAFKLLGSQIHNLDPMQKGQIWNTTGIDLARNNVQAIYLGKIIKLAFQCILQTWIWSSLEGVMVNLLQLVQALEFQ